MSESDGDDGDDGDVWRWGTPSRGYCCPDATMQVKQAPLPLHDCSQSQAPTCRHLEAGNLRPCATHCQAATDIC